MPNTSNRLTARERCVLSACAAALLLVTSMTQCAALDANQLLRETLWIASSLLSLLCGAILLEDTVVRPLANSLRRFLAGRAIETSRT